MQLTVQSSLEKHQVSQMTQTLYSPDLAPCNFCLFPKLKSPLKGKRFQAMGEIQENITGQLMVNGRTVWDPKVPTLKGTEVSLSYVQCFLCLVSSPINVCVSYYMAGYILERPPIFTDSHLLPSALASFHSWESSSRWLRKAYTSLTNSICF